MTSEAPLYAQVEQSLVARFGVDLSPGDRLPTENALIHEFQVSRITIRRALQNLAARNLIVTKRGRGSFVAHPRIRQPLTSLTGFVEDMAAHGLHSRARVVKIAEVLAPPEARRALQLPLGAQVTHIERVRLATGQPVSFDVTYLPVDLGRLIAQDDLVNEQIFTLLEDRHDTPLIEAAYALQASTAAPRVADALRVPEGTAIFRIERTSMTTGLRPVDYEILHYRGDAITFTTRLPRRGAEGGGEQ